MDGMALRVIGGSKVIPRQPGPHELTDFGKYKEVLTLNYSFRSTSIPEVSRI